MHVVYYRCRLPAASDDDVVSISDWIELLLLEIPRAQEPLVTHTETFLLNPTPQIQPPPENQLILSCSLCTAGSISHNKGYLLPTYTSRIIVLVACLNILYLLPTLLSCSGARLFPAGFYFVLVMTFGQSQGS